MLKVEYPVICSISGVYIDRRVPNELIEVVIVLIRHERTNENTAKREGRTRTI